MNTLEVIGTVVSGMLIIAGVYVLGYTNGNHQGWNEGFDDGIDIGKTQGRLDQLAEQARIKLNSMIEGE